uniref:protein-tyrosine-phosphatase n=1 Tax=Eptatretus burgeri TaxID=7764 RepID=A0A8C4WWW7_EPTBU
MAVNSTEVMILTEDVENRVDHGLGLEEHCRGPRGPGNSPRVTRSALSPLMNGAPGVGTSPSSKRNTVQHQQSSMDCGSDGACAELRGEALSFLSPCSHLESQGVKRMKKSLSRSGIQAERKTSSFQRQFLIPPCFSEKQEASPVLVPSNYRDPCSPLEDFSEKENISPQPFPKLFNLSETPKPSGDCEGAAQREEDSENLFCLATVDNKEESHAVPSSVATLILAPFVCHNEDKKLSETSVQKHLRFRSGCFFRSPSAPTSSSLDMLKQQRHEHNEQVPLDSSPSQNNHCDSSAAKALLSMTTLPQWEQNTWNGQENSEESIGDASEESSKDLFDSSLTPILPHAMGVRPGLCYITPETLVSALEGAYVEHIDKLLVVDCRYPYEFQGGHIRGAWNLYTKEELQENLLDHPLRPSRSQGRVIIVFHCEFSSERGPRQYVHLIGSTFVITFHSGTVNLRGQLDHGIICLLHLSLWFILFVASFSFVFSCECDITHPPHSTHLTLDRCHALRQMDRKMNINKYPKVFYPELYVLLGGYREFFLNAPVREDLKLISCFIMLHVILFLFLSFLFVF